MEQGARKGRGAEMIASSLDGDAPSHHAAHSCIRARVLICVVFLSSTDAKAHRNGLKKPKLPRFVSLKGVSYSLVACYAD